MIRQRRSAKSDVVGCDAGAALSSGQEGNVLLRQQMEPPASSMLTFGITIREKPKGLLVKRQWIITALQSDKTKVSKVNSEN